MFKDILAKEEMFSFQIDRSLSIISTSYNLTNSNVLQEYLDKGIVFLLEKLFKNDSFSNTKYFESLVFKINSCFTDRTSTFNQVIVSDEMLEFLKGVELDTVLIRFNNFRVIQTKQLFYKNLLEDYKDIFPIFSTVNSIGSFLIDLTKDNNKFYANDIFSNFFNIVLSKDLSYDIDLINEKILDRDFYFRLDLLIENEILMIQLERNYDNKWYKIDCKAVKKDVNGKVLMIGGVVQDVSIYHEFQEIERSQKIYELAIRSGRVGIFYYNLDKYTNKYFEANDIYGEIFGISPNENDLYSFADFSESLLKLEPELSAKESTINSASKLLQGEISGTTDDIIKIKDGSTGELKYLLSSSHIDERYEDGSPRRFGGTVVDITERVVKEMNQIKFAYNDELTSLANNRKLMKDLPKFKHGVGIFIDLDKFKKINDQYGHAYGDRALQCFGKALIKTKDLIDDVFVYRLHGDEFFVFGNKKEITFIKDFTSLLTTNIKELSNECKLKVLVEFSFGSSVYNIGTDIDDFIKEADYSMYRQKIVKNNK